MQGVTLTDLQEAEKTIGRSRSTRTREQENEEKEKEEKEKQDKEKQEEKKESETSREDEYKQKYSRTYDEVIVYNDTARSNGRDNSCDFQIQERFVLTTNHIQNTHRILIRNLNYFDMSRTSLLHGSEFKHSLCF